MALKKKLSFMLVVVIIFSATIFASAGDNRDMGRVVVNSGEPDANGVFITTLTVYNATFNAFQFAFSYNKEAISPVSKTGMIASSFSDCAKSGEQTSSWMLPLGNNLDIQRGLIECGGYVKPGSGSITADDSGIELYTFTFRQIGKGDAGIKLATSDSGGPFNPSIKEGGGLAEAGYNVDAIIEIKLPKSLGNSVTEKILAPISNVSAKNNDLENPKKIRLKNTVILQIGNSAVTKDGILTRVDKENSLVMPYIDQNNRTMVPVRFLSESLGAIVNWDNDKRQIIISYNEKRIIMNIDSKEYSVNNVSKTMDTVAVINKGWNRTMVPVRFIVEELSMDVKWDHINKLVIVSPLSRPWDMEGTVENEVLNNVLLLFSPLMREFI